MHLYRLAHSSYSVHFDPRRGPWCHDMLRYMLWESWQQTTATVKAVKIFIMMEFSFLAWKVSPVVRSPWHVSRVKCFKSAEGVLFGVILRTKCLFQKEKNIIWKAKPLTVKITHAFKTQTKSSAMESYPTVKEGKFRKYMKIFSLSLCWRHYQA